MKPSFESLNLSPALVAVVHALGYVSPTAIQAAAIPALLGGRDLIGQSQTGSGKTAAFGLPILERLELGSRCLQVLVLCPTRELSAQVSGELRKLGRANVGFAVLELVGGKPSRPQREALERGVHVAVGTPGRIVDHLRRGFLKLGSVRTVVLDEADRLLDMGFGAEVGEILDALPMDRQNVLFSATIPESLSAISGAFREDTLRITIETPTEAKSRIRQLQLVAAPEDHFQALCWLLHSHAHESALIFCNFKASVAALVDDLARAGLSADRLDGDLDQFQRDQVLARFRNQSLHLLVATDIAGRGLDVEGLDLVINFELPSKPEIYMHRIGRTGRAGRQGVAISLASSANAPQLTAAAKLSGETPGMLTRDASNDPGLDSLLGGLARRPKMATIQISGGRKDKIRAGDILGALTGEAGGLRGNDIGMIELQDQLAYVAVTRSLVGKAVMRLNLGRIKGKRFRATQAGS